MSTRGSHTCLLIAALVLACCASLGGCADPIKKGEWLAARNGFERQIVPGDPFRHVVFRATGRSGDELHVYIDGDGTPYANGITATDDPTPRRPLMLELMALDPSPAVYIGRPCYWGLAQDPGCNALYWTLGRFNTAVVNSCTAAIRRELAATAARRWSLYAHSGGATIAMLVAQQLGTADRIVTIGPNLDIDAWTALHHYTRLTASENPAARMSQPIDVPAVHYVGALDVNTPPGLVEAAAQKTGGRVLVIDDYSHTCCWERVWANILAATDPHDPHQQGF
jgi:pimeloyl-ACP methyl ester carboxylesterase